MSKTQNDLKNVKLPSKVMQKIKTRASQKGTSIMQWLLNAAAAAYLSETGEDLLEPDEHETNAI
jgi:predicted DNA binding CopG/RHH family protein